MSDKATIVIEAKADGVKRTFDEVTNGAKTMGDSVADAGEKGAQGLDDLKKKSTEVGAAIGTAVAAVSLLGQAYVSQEQELTALRTAYGSAADEIIGFTNQLQDTTIFSNEQARDAAQLSATLARQYGFTTQEIEKVLQVSADLASVTGLDLADATERVTGALRGETEGAERLGLTLNQQSIDREGLTLTMTNEEAAHFRLNAILQQAAYAEGAAADKAKTHAGEARQLINQVQDLAASFGGSLGPIGEYASVLGNVALIAPAAGAGIGRLASGITSAGSLAAALGPAGLAAAAIAAGAGIIYLTETADNYTDAALSAVSVTTDLTNFFTSMAAISDPNRAGAIIALRDGINATIADAAQRQSDLDKLLSIQMGITNEGISLVNEQAMALAESITGFDSASLLFLDTNDDLVLSIDEVNTAVALYTANLDRLDATQQATVSKDIASLFSQTGLDFEKASAQLKAWQFGLDNGTISGEQFVALIHGAAVNFGEYLIANNEATSANKRLTASQSDTTKAIQDTQAAVKAQIYMYGASNSVIASYAAGQREADAATEDTTAAVEAQIKVVENQASTVGQTTSVINTYTESQRSSIGYAFAVTKAAADETIAMNLVRDALKGTDEATRQVIPGTELLTSALDAQSAKAAAISASIDDYAKALGRVPLMENKTAFGFSARASAAGTALGDAFRVAVGNTNQIGSQAQGVADWAKELINVRNETGKIDDLLARSVITQREYNDAQDAGTRIFAANAAIQDDILKIQTDQAPIIAQLTEEQQRYMDHLADLPADQQMIRLAYMDTNESLKAQQALALAAAAANGELGAAGEASAQSLIAGAAAADPYLKSLLTDMGVISVGADGTITVNFGDVKDANSDMDRLITALTDLTNALEGEFNIDIVSNALAEAGNLESLSGWLDNLNGKHSTVYIDTVGNLGPTGGGQETALHGGVMGYARGGVVARMAEGNRPELLHFRGGGTALAMTDGLYNVPQGTYVTPAPATRQSLGNGGGVIHINNPIINLYPPNADVHSQLQEWATGGSR